MFPVFASTRAKARAVTCSSHMSQVAKAVISYSYDWNRALPFPCNEQDVNNWWTNTWRERVLSYVGGDSSVMLCPIPTYKPEPWVPKDMQISHYGMNFDLTHPAFSQLGTPGPYGFTFSYTDEISDPGSTIMISENFDGDWSGEPYEGNPQHMAGCSYGPGTFWPYHNGRGTFAFCDGHVRAMTWKEAEANNFYLWKKYKP